MTSTQVALPPRTSHAGLPAAPTLEIASAVAGLYKEALGYGPKRATVHFTPPATLVVMLEDTMIAAERTLAALGEDERLRKHRLTLTGAIEDRLRSIVEHALGKRTLALVSGIDTRRDVAAHVFTLDPDAR